MAKIINYNHHIFFITTEGLCYYINADVRESSIVLIQALSDYYVENVFVLDYCVIIQYDGDKLCRLSLSASKYTNSGAKAYDVDMCYIKGTWKPTALPFLMIRVLLQSRKYVDEYTMSLKKGRYTGAITYLSVLGIRMRSSHTLQTTPSWSSVRQQLLDQPKVCLDIDRYYH